MKRKQDAYPGRASVVWAFVAAETAIVPDFPIVNKSFDLCYSCTDR